MLQKYFTLFSILICGLLICNNALAIQTHPTKTVLITGGVSGLGRDISIAFQKDGWDVWATSRNPENYAALPGVNVRKLDITNASATQQLINEIQTKSGRLDVLINNAGYGIIGPEEATSMQQVKDLFAVNVLGPMQLTQQALPLMRKHRAAHIINISSTSGLRALPGLGVYAASKMALEGLSEALAAELAPWNISVVLIEPGTVNNDWVKNAQLAANLDAYPGYANFTKNLQQSLTTKAKEVGQESQEVAQLTLDIAKNPKPNLRYQSNQQSASIAAEVIADPTGNLMRDKMVGFAKQFYDLPVTF